MDKYTLRKIKQEGLFALLIPAMLLICLQTTLKHFSFYQLLAMVMATIAVIGFSFYRFFVRLNEISWQQQLSSIIQKVSSAIMVVDQENKVLYANDNFYRLPIATLLNQHYQLPELLAEVTGERSLQAMKTIQDSLRSLVGKMKVPFQWNNEHYELVLIGLTTPAGKRFGTVVECIKMTNTFQQMNTVALSVNRHKQDIHDELLIIKDVIQEQQQPIDAAMHSIELAIVQTVKHSETVTLVLQALHENQQCLDEFKAFGTQVDQLPKEIFAFIDDIKQAIGVSKQKLHEILVDDEKLKMYCSASLEILGDRVDMNGDQHLHRLFELISVMPAKAGIQDVS